MTKIMYCDGCKNDVEVLSDLHFDGFIHDFCTKCHTHVYPSGFIPFTENYPSGAERNLLLRLKPDESGFIEYAYFTYNGQTEYNESWDAWREPQ